MLVICKLMQKLHFTQGNNNKGKCTENCYTLENNKYSKQIKITNTEFSEQIFKKSGKTITIKVLYIQEN